MHELLKTFWAINQKAIQVNHETKLEYDGRITHAYKVMAEGYNIYYARNEDELTMLLQSLIEVEEEEEHDKYADEPTNTLQLRAFCK